MTSNPEFGLPITQDEDSIPTMAQMVGPTTLSRHENRQLRTAGFGDSDLGSPDLYRADQSSESLDLLNPNRVAKKGRFLSTFGPDGAS